MPDHRWVVVLRDLEQRLERWRTALWGDAPPPDPYELPADLGPCPPELLPKARRILESQRVLFLEGEARAAAIRSALAIKVPQRPQRPAVFVDERS